MKKRYTHAFIFICIFFCCGLEKITAQTALVKDIEPGTGSSMTYSYFVTMGPAAYFVALTSANSYELWKTDATTGGTTLVKDINPGTGNANPTSLFVNGSTLYFLADNGTNGKELWKSDGTTAGTLLVKDIAAGATQGVSNYSFFGALGSTIFFQANAGTTGYELWKSDGTAAGTVLVKDIFPGASSGFGSTSYYAVVGSTFFFTATDGTNGIELWKSDGTTAGTSMVKDIYAGATSSDPQNFSVLGSTLYFTATTAAGGSELWKSDGTATGTVLVKDINPGTPSSSATYFTPLGTNLFFRATNGTNGYELWKTDGSTAGTVMVSDIYAGASDAYPTDFTIFNSTLYFNATTAAAGAELWKSDGTTAGTSLVKDIYAGTTSSNASDFTVVGSTLFFSASTAANGNELWKTDGSTAGTVLVRDITVGTGSSGPTNMANMNGTLYFQATEDVAGYNFGSEVFKSDGTNAGTLMVNNLAPGGSSIPSNFLYLNSTILFIASDGTSGFELFKVTTGHHQVAYFSASPTTLYTNSPYNVTNFTDHTPNDPVSWSWTFTGGTPSTSTARNPTNITYTTPGCYQVSLTTTFASGSDNETKTCYIQVVDVNSIYCGPGGVTGSYYIDGVTLGSINNLGTGALNGPSYHNYTSLSTTLNQAQTYTITIDGRGAANVAYAAFLDYNRDGDFDDANEALDQVMGYVDASNVRTISFTVPTGTYIGTTRLRIRVADNHSGSNWIYIDPCSDGSWQNGETEDYNVVIAGGLAPVADFSASNLSPNAGTSINFTDLSTNTPTSWSWAFTGGSPATSTAKNPTNILYNTPGCYQVTLTATNVYGSDPEVKTCYINVLNPSLAPVADFSANLTTIVTGGSVNFTDLSTNTPTGWSWSFTGASTTTSTLKNPTGITYPTAGVYTVALTATNANGSNTKTKTAYITVQDYCAPLTDYGTTSGDYINGVSAISGTTYTVLMNNPNTGGGAAYKNYTNKVVNLSLGEPYNIGVDIHPSTTSSYGGYGAIWIDWNKDGDFNDTGERVYEASINPSSPSMSTMLIYVPATASVGSTRMRVRFMRTATANTSPCNNYNYGETEDYGVFISAQPSGTTPVANFSANVTTIAAGGNVNFTDLSTNNPTSWSWSFTGGTPATSTLQNVSGVNYSTPGCYQVSLTATNYYGSDPEVKTCYINVTAPPTPPVANFTASSTSIAIGGSTNFTDLSTNVPTSWSWSFTGGTPSTSTLKNPTGITYPAAGCYQVSLTATNAYGSDPEVKTCYINVTATGGTYCTVGTPQYGTSDGDYIDGVTLGSINNINTGSTTGTFYYDYTSLATSLTKAGTYTINIKSGTWVASYPDYYDVWIDYNHNYDFNDNGEKLGEFLSSAPLTTEGITFTVPATALTGNTRMRVRGSYSSTAGIDPCEVKSYGETEDYTVNILPPAVTPVAAFSASATTIITGGSTNFTDLSTNNPTSWSWSFTGGTPATSTLQNPTGITYPAPGCYQVTLTATNSAGSDPEVKTCYINVVSIPAADFSASSTNINVGGSTGFTDLSTNSPTSWSWAFTGGTPATSTLQNPTGITYPAAGCYQVTLTATNAAGSDTAVKTCYINVTLAPPAADFSASSTSFTAGGSTNFTDLSTNAPTSWTWAFTGGTPATSTSQNPTGITYPAAGCYQVTLTATNSAGSDQEVKTCYINVTAPVTPPTADFAASATSITAGGSTNFTDLSTNTPTSWSWAFTGGTPATSTVKNPMGITYPTAGCYQVTLTATNAGGSDPEVKTCYINVAAAPVSVCDTLQNYQNSNNFFVYQSTSGGYVAGHNSFGDVAKADLFTTYTPGAKIKGAYLKFGKAKYSTTAKTISVKVWDNDGIAGVPSTVLATKTVTIASIAPNVTAGNFTYVQFASPVSVTGPFYLGIEFAYASGDTVALFSNTNGQTTPGTAWEEFNTGDWHAMSEAGSWGMNISQQIRPVLCSPATETEDVYSGFNFNVYPNPNAGEFTLEVNTTETIPVKYTIINSIGKVIVSKELKSSAGSHSEQLSLGEYASGIYYVILQSNDILINKKIIIQK